MGRGKRVLMVQFIKGPWKSGEDEFAKKFSMPEEKFQLHKMGLGFVGILGDALPREEHEKAARRALEFFKSERASGTWNTFILDEVNVAVSLGLLKIEEVLEAIKDFPEDHLLVLTGRSAPEELLRAADLVTEMKEVKHPFQEGKLAKWSVEF